MDESRLIEKLRAIEALFAGAKTPGEKDAAARARERIQERLGRQAAEAPPVEYRFSMSDAWSRRVFIALLRRYGLKPYRYPRQRYNTVMVRVPRRFVDETLWPEFRQLDLTLRAHLSEVTERVVAAAMHADSSEPDVVPQALGDGVGAAAGPVDLGDASGG